jgi:hypothetical protein
MSNPSPIGAKWYKCKGCGQACCIGPNGIGHEKPANLIGIPNSVTCPLYRQCNTREFFMKYMAGEPLPDPDKIEPILG